MSAENQHINYETFRKYYTGAMTPDEKSMFEKNLENDPFAQDAFEGFLSLETDLARITAIDNTNKKLNEKLGLDKTENTFPIKSVVGIAASVVLLVGSIFVFKNNFSETKTIAENVVLEPEIIEEVLEVVVDSEKIYLNDTNRIKISAEEDFEDLQVPIESQNVIADQITTSDKKTLGQAQSGANNMAEVESAKKDSRGVGANSSAKATESKTATFNTVPIVSDKESDASLEMISDYKSGIVYYNQSQYAEAIKAFNSSITKKQNVSSSNYYIGMSYFNLGNTNNAITYLDKVIGTDSAFADDAQYYKAITLIGKGQKEKAKVILNELANSSSSFKNAAQNKLKSL